MGIKPAWLTHSYVPVPPDELLQPLVDMTPEGSSIVQVYCEGDPSPALAQDARPFLPAAPRRGQVARWIRKGHNIYTTVSAFKVLGEDKWDDGSGVLDVNRQSDNWTCGLFVMIDDLALEVDRSDGKKAPLSNIADFEPTVLIETHKGNYQALYYLKEPVTDRALFEALMRATAKKGDRGSGGINRIARAPWGYNRKAKYKVDGHFPEVHAVHFNPARRFTVNELIAGLGLKLDIKPARLKITRALPTVEEEVERLETFGDILSALKRHGFLISKDRKRELLPGEAEEWASVTKDGEPGKRHQLNCPFTENHGGRHNKSGAALFAPSRTNKFFGGFLCAHEGCGGIDRNEGDGPEGVPRAMFHLARRLDALDIEYFDKMADDLLKINDEWIENELEVTDNDK